MKRFVTSAVLLLSAIISFAQIGIGTTSPNSTLDVRGSLAINYRAFTSGTTAGTDYTLVFTGTTAGTLTLPDATTVQGRVYWIKNASSNASALTIATTSSQTIDGASSWSLTQTNKVVAVVSNGTNWYTVGESVPGNGSGSAWVLGGNSLSSTQNLGTTSSHDLPFITGGTERMRLTTGGSLGIGTSTFNGTNPERLIVDAGTNGSGAFQNVIVGKGNTNSYAQLNIQNNYNGTAAGTIASSDVVATSDNGNETVNYIDMGINSSGNNSTGVLGGANVAYLYSTGNNFAIGNGSNSKDILFFTTTSGTFTERMRINNNGLLPGANNTYNLGSNALKWANIYSQNLLNVSDARLKTNIRNLHYGLSTILNIRPVQFNWKEGNDKDEKIGFLAQELRSVIPEVVVGEESKETLTVNYIELIPVLVNAIKEQQQQIEVLKKKITVLENR